jgi:mono/diheme cytochrome c family protein
MGAVKMNRRYWRCVAVLVALSPIAVASTVQAQQNGEAHSAVATVVREDYDMARFMAPLSLTETELQGRQIFARRCANCHGATDRRPGPLLGQETVERRGESSIREHVLKGSPIMPGFEYNLDAAAVDGIIAFLKTVPAAPPQPTASPD